MIVVDASVLAPALADDDVDSAYDASYVALAEALDAVLVTADGRIKRATGVNCEVSILR